MIVITADDCRNAHRVINEAVFYKEIDVQVAATLFQVIQDALDRVLAYSSLDDQFDIITSFFEPADA